MASDFDQLPDYNSLEANEYRSLSPGAVFGLVLGLLSPLALVAPFLGFLPVVAAVVSWSAARSIRKSPETRAGIGFAFAGLGLAVAVMAATFTQGRVAQGLHQADADRVAEQFLARLRAADTIGAYELTLAHHKRLSDDRGRLHVLRSGRNSGPATCRISRQSGDPMLSQRG